MGAQTGPGRLPEAKTYLTPFLPLFWSVLGSISGPHWDPFALQFSFFFAHVFFTTFSNKLWEPIFIDFGTILASIMELVLLLVQTSGFS